MIQRGNKVILSLILLILFLGLGIALIRYDSSVKRPDNYVVRVIDGDTLEIATGEKVRLLCINTPEEGHKDYGNAKAYLSSLVLGKEVTLIPSSPNKDEYDRLLRFVYLNDTFINKKVSEQYFTDEFYYNNSDCDRLMN